MSYLVYKHTSPSGKSYIGLTSKTVEKRFKKHCADIGRRTSHFLTALHKYGPENFTTEVLVDSIGTFVEAASTEMYYIAFYNTFLGDGYNMTSGGEGTKAPNSELQKETARRNWTGKNNPNYGGITDKKHLEKLSKAAKRKGPMTEETKEKIAVHSRGSNNNMYGKHHSSTTRKLQSETAKNRAKKECTYCGKLVDVSNYVRWHGNKCKEKDKHA